MPLAPINGIQLYYEDTDPGGGAKLPAVLLLHGAYGNGMSWWQQVPTFRATHRCITMDQRGFFRSVDTTREFGLRFIDDIEALVDYLGLARVALVGQSMGGRAAIGYAVRRQDKVDALVLSSTWGMFEWPEQWERLKDAIRVPDPNVEIGRIRGLAAGWQRKNPDLTFLFQQIGGAGPCLSKPSGPLPGCPTIDDVRAMRVPLLCICGNQDTLGSAPLIRHLVDEVRGAEIVEIEDGGHAIYFEQPKRFNELVLDFLRKHEQSPAA